MRSGQLMCSVFVPVIPETAGVSLAVRVLYRSGANVSVLTDRPLRRTNSLR